MSRDIKTPGPDHPIRITPSSDHVVVRSGEATIADSRSTLVLHEASYPPVAEIKGHVAFYSDRVEFTVDTADRAQA